VHTLKQLYNLKARVVVMASGRCVDQTRISNHDLRKILINSLVIDDLPIFRTVRKSDRKFLSYFAHKRRPKQYLLPPVTEMTTVVDTEMEFIRCYYGRPME